MAEIRTCADQACQNEREQMKSIIESGGYLQRIFQFSEYEKAIECVRKLWTTLASFFNKRFIYSHNRVLEDENKFFLQRFEEEKKAHKEELNKYVAQVKLSEENRDTEKKRYKKKIASLQEELKKVQEAARKNVKKAVQLSDSEDEDETNEEEDKKEDKLDENTTDFNCAAHSSAAIPLVAGFREGLCVRSK